MEFFDLEITGWVALIAGGLLVYFLATPLIILMTFRHEALPHVLPIDEDSLPLAESDEHLIRTRQELESLGFECVGRYGLPHQIDNVRAMLDLFVSHSPETSAMSVVMYILLGETWKRKTAYVEFSTTFTDGSFVDTMNSTEVGAFCEPRRSVKTQHPELTDARALHAAHEAMNDWHFPGSSRYLKLEKRFHGDAPSYLAAVITEELESARQDGYVRLVGGDQESFTKLMDPSNPYEAPPARFTPPSYMATIKGAYLMTWSELWPLKSLKYWSRIRRDRLRLQETGYQWN